MIPPSHSKNMLALSLAIKVVKFGEDYLLVARLELIVSSLLNFSCRVGWVVVNENEIHAKLSYQLNCG